MLCRAKKGKSPSERIEALCNEMLFDNLRAQDPEIFNKKIVPLVGEVMHDKLGKFISIENWGYPTRFMPFFPTPPLDLIIFICFLKKVSNLKPAALSKLFHLRLMIIRRMYYR